MQFLLGQQRVNAKPRPPPPPQQQQQAQICQQPLLSQEKGGWLVKKKRRRMTRTGVRASTTAEVEVVLVAGVVAGVVEVRPKISPNPHCKLVVEGAEGVGVGPIEGRWRDRVYMQGARPA